MCKNGGRERLILRCQMSWPPAAARRRPGRPQLAASANLARVAALHHSFTIGAVDSARAAAALGRNSVVACAVRASVQWQEPCQMNSGDGRSSPQPARWHPPQFLHRERRVARSLPQQLLLPAFHPCWPASCAGNRRIKIQECRQLVVYCISQPVARSISFGSYPQCLQ